MSRFAHLPTLADRPRMAVPKGPTRLETKAARAKKDEKQWTACKRIVDVRDGRRCRCCHRSVAYVIDLQANRAEHHHIVRRRKEPALLHDPRNVILLCCACHVRVTQRRLHIIGKAVDMFTFKGKSYLNADHPLVFAA